MTGGCFSDSPSRDSSLTLDQSSQAHLELACDALEGELKLTHSQALYPQHLREWLWDAA